MSTVEKHYHAVQFYSDEDSLARTVAGFLTEGLNQDHPGIVIATPSHTDALVRALTALGTDVNALRRKGDLHFLDAQKTLRSFMIGPRPDSIQFKSQMGAVIEKICAGRRPCPIRAYGEMVDLLWQDGNADGAIQMEMLWNRLAAEYDFSLLCGYAFGHFYKQTGDPGYQKVCAQHSHVIEGPGGNAAL